jgi:methylaspartate ammonia-lyase
LSSTVVDILTASVWGGYFNDDQVAMATAKRDGEFVDGVAVTDGFAAPRVPARPIGIGLVLDDGFVAWGDAALVQYAGVAGREPLPDPAIVVPAVKSALTAHFSRTPVEAFRETTEAAVEALRGSDVRSTAIEYALSQAVLRAVAHGLCRPPAVVVAEEYALEPSWSPVPVYAQSGNHQHANVDKMIQKQVEVLPHGLVSSLDKVGEDGDVLAAYVSWTRERIAKRGAPGYQPALQFDVYGLLSRVFDDDLDRIGAYIERLAELADGLPLRIESPVIAGSRAEQIEALATLREHLDDGGSGAAVVVDEWCNTLDDIREFGAARAGHFVHIKVPDLGALTNAVDAVLEARRLDMGSFLGGSCTETESSAMACVHVAVATDVDYQLAKPGMGVDEGVMIVRNEQARLLAEVASRPASAEGETSSMETAGP